MEKFSYYLELYQMEIFDLDEMIEHEDQIKDAIKIENHLHLLNDNIDIIRNAIINSIRFEKILSYDERLNHVRGIIYSMHYMNHEDLNKFVDDLSNTDISILEKSLFEIRTFSDNYDKDFFRDYMHNLKIKDEEEDITEDYLKGKLNSIGETIVIEEKDDMTVEEFFEDSYKMKELVPLERLELFKKYYPLYKEGILEYKGIKEGTEEYKFVSKGMDAYNNFIIGCFEIMASFIDEELKRKSRNLLFTI